MKLDGAAAVIPGPPGAATDKRPPESLPALVLSVCLFGLADVIFKLVDWGHSDSPACL